MAFIMKFAYSCNESHDFSFPDIFIALFLFSISYHNMKNFSCHYTCGINLRPSAKNTFSFQFIDSHCLISK